MKRLTFVFAGLIAIIAFILLTKPEVDTTKKAQATPYEQNTPKVYN